MKKIRIIIIILVLIFLLIFPILIDYLYGQGVLKYFYKNSFPANEWFAFLGSYIPATIIGILTIYQAYIIQRKDKEYQELLNRHRFILAKHASIYKYDKNNKDDNGRFSDFKTEIGINDFQKSYLLEASLHNSTSVEIDQIRVKDIKICINGKYYEQEKFNILKCITVRESYDIQRIVILWGFKDDDIQEIFTECMLSYIRGNLELMHLILFVVFEIADSINEKSCLNMWLDFKSGNDQNSITSVEEKCNVGKKC